jgi:hypothetical protein
MIKADVTPLVERYETVAEASLRVVLVYDGDEYETKYVRSDVEESYSPEEFDEKLKQLVVEGISNPQTQGQFRRYGRAEAVLRRFENALVLHYPLGEFSGIALTFDRATLPSADTLMDIGSDYVSELDAQ